MKLEGLQKEIFLNRYALSDETEWDQCARRVAKNIARAENDDQMSYWENEFFDVINNGYFVPGGRILRNAGRKRQSLINCFISELNDDSNSIGDFLKTTYMVGIYEGGFGYIGNVRPLGSPIAGVNFAAPGVINTVTCIDDIGKHTRSGGGRRGAIWAGVRISHPDVWYWIDAKKDLKKLNNHNISVIINNEFIKAIEEDKEWHFIWNNKEWYLFELKRNNNEEILVVAPDQDYAIGIANTFFKQHFTDQFSFNKKRRLKAKELWQKIIDNASHNAGGEPGIINESLIEKDFTAGYYTHWIGMNGCTEVTAGAPHDVCCLGHINLAALYDPKTNDIDYKLMQKIIHTGVRFLDNVLTLNDYPLPEIKAAAQRGRRIGFGYLGLAHLLIKMGIRYGSEKCINFMNRFMSTMRNETYKASIQLAKEKGVFPAFNKEEHIKNDFIQRLPANIKKDIQKYGLRNVALLLLAPTGTISVVLNTSSSLEPIFAPVYKRKYRKGESLYEDIVVDPLFENLLKENKNPDYFVGAYDITAEEHLKVLSTAQTYLDQAISKTTNIPKDYENKDLSELILQYVPYIKTLTLYRENSRPDEPLTPIKIDSDEFKQLIKTKYKIGAESQECLTGTCEL